MTNSMEMQREASVEVVEDFAGKHHHADAALEFVENHEGVTFTEAEENALVRKIDWILMPLVC